MPSLAVPDSERRTRYVPVTATPEFDVGFTIYDTDDLVVYHDGVEIARDDETDGWTVSGTTDAYGQITDAVVATEGDGWFGVTVDIVGRRKGYRADQFTDNRGVPAKDQNLILNRIVATTRELYDRIARSVVGAFGETIDQLPAAASRANKIFGFDALGQPDMRDDLIGATGDNGWAPTFAIVSDSARRVLQLTGYVGGEGTEPTDDVGKYVGATQMETLIANGVDIRGAAGASGAGTGDLLAANNLDDLDNAATARTNLGLGGLAVLGVSDLGDAAVLDTIGYANVTAADIANAAQIVAGTASKLVNAAEAASAIPTLALTVCEPLGAVRDINTVTASATLALTDAGKNVEANHATVAIQILIPTNAAVAFPTDSYVNVIRYGAAAVTVKGDTGVTINGVSAGTITIGSQYGGVTLYKRGTNEWVAPNATAV